MAKKHESTLDHLKTEYSMQPKMNYSTYSKSIANIPPICLRSPLQHIKACIIYVLGPDPRRRKSLHRRVNRYSVPVQCTRRQPSPELTPDNRLFASRRKEALNKVNITHVVSVLRLPLDNDLFVKFKHHVVEIDDVEDENVIEHFPTSNAFIQQGLDRGGGVLVHW